MHEALFPLSALSPLGTVFRGDVRAINLPTIGGEITVHMPTVTALAEGEVRITADSLWPSREDFSSSAGMGLGYCPILQRKLNENIEIARVEAAKKRAEDLLKEKKERKDLILVERDLQRAILQLKVAEKIRKRRSGPV